MIAESSLRHRALVVMAAVGVLSGCQGSAVEEPTPAPVVPCEALFGLPTESTGLGPEACAPACECGAEPWTPPVYEQAWIEGLTSWTLINPPTTLDEDPYGSEVPAPAASGSVCAALFDVQGATYTLETYPSVGSAAEAGAVVTHAGGCGLCSSLQNLVVYMGQPDLTDPVRECGIQGLLGSAEANIACLQDIGFDGPCAEIWYFNTNHTRDKCLDLCMAALESPHHTEDGSLNPCIQCDEDLSGPVFKAVAGRTRRNSGLPSALCRPCDTVYPLTHDYP
ncbi:MAG: hypothetical protein VX938_12485 [Myxococcota bacterium]|nr:hypothetical protein [Myxococcota bacterium]